MSSLENKQGGGTTTIALVHNLNPFVHYYKYCQYFCNRSQIYHRHHNFVRYDINYLRRIVTPVQGVISLKMPYPDNANQQCPMIQT